MKLCTTFPVVLLSFVMVTLVFFGAGPAAGRLGRVAIVRNRLRAHNSTCQGSQFHQVEVLGSCRSCQS